jgi:hypothetical protein
MAFRDRRYADRDTRAGVVHAMSQTGELPSPADYPKTAANALFRRRNSSFRLPAVAGPSYSDWLSTGPAVCRQHNALPETRHPAHIQR